MSKAGLAAVALLAAIVLGGCLGEAPTARCRAYPPVWNFGLPDGQGRLDVIGNVFGGASIVGEVLQTNCSTDNLVFHWQGEGPHGNVTATGRTMTMWGAIPGVYNATLQGRTLDGTFLWESRISFYGFWETNLTVSPGITPDSFTIPIRCCPHYLNLYLRTTGSPNVRFDDTMTLSDGSGQPFIQGWRDILISEAPAAKATTFDNFVYGDATLTVAKKDPAIVASGGRIQLYLFYKPGG